MSAGIRAAAGMAAAIAGPVGTAVTRGIATATTRGITAGMATPGTDTAWGSAFTPTRDITTRTPTVRDTPFRTITTQIPTLTARPRRATPRTMLTRRPQMPRQRRR